MFSVPELADLLGCHRSNLVRHIHRGNLSADRVGRFYVVSEDDASDFARRYDFDWPSDVDQDNS
jgi:excisionase family DNA binding protein